MRAVWLVGLFGVLISVSVGTILFGLEQERLETEFRSRAQERVAAIETAFETAEVIVDGVSALYRSSDSVSREQFRAFVQTLRDLHPGIQGFGFNPRVLASERAEHEAATRREGFADYQITERSPDGALVRAGDRPEYVVVNILEPLEGNRKAHGYDIASEPVRRAALERAVASGEVSATAGIRLVQEREDQMGILVCGPVFRIGELTETVAQRRAALRGFVVGVFRVGQLVEQALSRLEPGGIHVRVLDGIATPTERVLHEHVARTAIEGESDFVPKSSEAVCAYEASIDVAGRAWTIRCMPEREFPASALGWSSLLGGLLFTVLLVVHMSRLTSVNARLSREIDEHRRTGQALQEMSVAVENAMTGISRLDCDGRFVMVRSGYAAMLGYTPEEMIGMAWEQTVVPDDLEAATKTYLSMLEEGRGEGDVRAVRKDGSVFWKQLLLVKSMDQDGVHDGHYCFMRDVTAKAEAEQALRLRDRAIRSASNGVVIADATQTDLPLVFVNEAYERMTGYTAAESVGRNCRFLQGSDVEQPPLAELREGIAAGRDVAVVLKNYRKDGSLFWNELVVAPVRDADGALTHFVGILTDITARKIAEDHNKRLEGELRQSQKLEAVGTLANGVAHDFNNLLNVIMGHSELAKLSLEESHEAYRSLEMIDKACEQATFVTGSLLTFSKGAIHEDSPVALQDVLREAVQLLTRLLPASITLHQDYPDDEVWVRGDRYQLKQVVMNLAINARDAMLEGGELRITLDGHPDQGADVGACLLSIADTGSGMTAEVRDRIFEPFYTTKERGRGTGLGLAVVHGIVSDHGGSITCHSAPEAGTRFCIELPTCAPIAPQDDSRVGGPRLTTGNGELLLLAEDDASLRGLLAKALRSAKYEVIDVGDGASALEAFRRHADSVALAILDIDLPQMSGLQCANEIRAIHDEALVLVMSGDPTRVSTPLGQRERRLAKPFGLAEFVETVGEMLRVDVSSNAG